MIDNEEIQEELEAEQTPEDELSVLEAALMASLLLTLTEVYAKYDTGNGLNMSKGKRKKNLFSSISRIVSDHYFKVSGLVEGNAKAAFESTYEKFMTAYEEELDLPLMEAVSASIIQSAFDRGYPLSKTMTHNRNVTTRLMRRQLIESFRQPETLQDLSVRVTEVVRNDRRRVETVVSNETSRMQSEAQVQSMADVDEQGVGVSITWHSLRDKKVRKKHQELHGQKADAEGYFHMDGDKAKAPGLWNSIGMNIKCRCYLEVRGVNVKDNELWKDLNSAESSSKRRELWEKRVALAKERKKGDIS